MDKWVQRVDGRRAERYHQAESETLPVMLRSTVRGHMTEGRFRAPWSKRLVLIKWVITGQALMALEGRRLPILPGQVAVYLPTHPHTFWCTKANTEMCWFSVDGPQAEAFVHTTGLRAGVFPYGPPPLTRIDAMIESLADQTPNGYRKSSLLAIEGLYDVAAHLPVPQTNSIVQQVRHLIREGLADPDLSASSLAQKLNYNRGALSRLFHRHASVTLIDAITQTRLQEAEMLLSGSDERISDVAKKCGFRDPSYFTRWLKKHTGRTPGELRDASTTDTPPTPNTPASAA